MRSRISYAPRRAPAANVMCADYMLLSLGFAVREATTAKKSGTRIEQDGRADEDVRQRVDSRSFRRTPDLLYEEDVGGASRPAPRPADADPGRTDENRTLEMARRAGVHRLRASHVDLLGLSSA